MDPAPFPRVPHPLAPDSQNTCARIDPVMERRTFMATLTGGLVVAPLSAEAQQARKVPKIGILTANSPVVLPGEEFFWDRMRELGWVEGQNIVVERRGAAGDWERIPIVAAELVNLKVDVMTIWAGGWHGE